MQQLYKPLQKEKILSFLGQSAKSIIQNNVFIHNTIDSTNLEAKRLLDQNKKNAYGSVVLAEQQTAGRGRLGRSFYSPTNSGIYLSFILRGENCIEDRNDSIAITVAAAVAVHRSLAHYGIIADIKWVNDLFFKGKKVCGILTEGIFSQDKTNKTGISSYIIGIGINVLDSKEGFPDEIKKIAGSLNKNIDRNELISLLLNNVIDVLAQDSNAIINEYRTHSCVLNKTVEVIKPNEKYLAEVLEITDEAHLIVKREDGSKEELLSGEISLRI